jgi:hypothetical protein
MTSWNPNATSFELRDVDNRLLFGFCNKALRSRYGAFRSTVCLTSDLRILQSVSAGKCTRNVGTYGAMTFVTVVS